MAKVEEVWLWACRPWLRWSGSAGACRERWRWLACTRPYRLGTPIFELKSSISSLVVQQHAGLGDRDLGAEPVVQPVRHRHRVAPLVSGLEDPAARVGGNTGYNLTGGLPTLVSMRAGDGPRSIPERPAIRVPRVRVAVKAVVSLLNSLRTPHRRAYHHLVALLAEDGHRVWAQPLFHSQLIRLPLVMNSRCGRSFCGIHAEVDCIDDRLQRSGDDSGSARASGDEPRIAIL